MKVDDCNKMGYSIRILINERGTAVDEIEPAIAPIFDMPIGTELTLVYEKNRKFFVYTETGERLAL